MALPIGGRGLLRGLAFVGAAAAGYAFGVTSDQVAAQPAAQPAAGQPQPPAPAPDPRVVAFLTNPVNNQLIKITREDLGEFLITRGGYDKLDLLVNKKIIEFEAARRGVTVTPIEVNAGLLEDVRGLGINLKDFEDRMLPHYHKSLYEWVEDVVKPRLLLTKMCYDRVKITDDDLKRAFENKYGERRQAKVICWSRDDLRAAERQWGDARNNDAEFERIAKQQADRSLAAAGGLVAPIGRYSEAADDSIEKMLYTLQPGEISKLFDTPQGIMCLKLHAVIPPDATKQLDDKTKSELTNELRAKRLEKEIGKLFQEIKSAAQPNVLLKGPPSAKEFRDGVNEIINNANLNRPPAGRP